MSTFTYVECAVTLNSKAIQKLCQDIGLFTDAFIAIDDSKFNDRRRLALMQLMHTKRLGRFEMPVRAWAQQNPALAPLHAAWTSVASEVAGVLINSKTATLSKKVAILIKLTGLWCGAILGLYGISTCKRCSVIKLASQCSLCI